MRPLLLVLCSLVACSAWAQVELETRESLRLIGIGKVQQWGDVILCDQLAAAIQKRPVIVLRVVSEAANVDLTVTTQSREPVKVDEIAPRLYLLDQPGKYWVDVTAIDFSKNIYGRKSVVVEVGQGPNPPPTPPPGPVPVPPSPPGPEPSPTGPFDGIASKVRYHALQMPSGQRNTITSNLRIVADKMQRFEFRQVDQARDFIARNWPPCTSQHCGELWELLKRDAERRQLSWQETQDYYREIAKGVSE